MPHVITVDIEPFRLAQFGEETDVLTGNLGSTAGPGGSTFRTDAEFAYAEEDVDGYFKLGDIKGAVSYTHLTLPTKRIV